MVSWIALIVGALSLIVMLVLPTGGLILGAIGTSIAGLELRRHPQEPRRRYVAVIALCLSVGAIAFVVLLVLFGSGSQFVTETTSIPAPGTAIP